MYPALVCSHRRIPCPHCGAVAPVPVSLPTTSSACWHCGDALDVAQLLAGSAQPRAILVPANLVHVEPVGWTRPATDGVTVGDLVALLIDGRLRVKRILATPDDTVTVDRLRLRVNGRRLEDVMADLGTETQTMIPVDHDPLRTESRWKPHHDTTSWIRRSQNWHTDSANDDSWLVYHHRAVYDQSQSSAVFDDYPINLHVTRQMAPIDRLALRLCFPETEDTAGENTVSVRVAFWTPRGTQEVSVAVPRNRSTTIRCYDATEPSQLVLTPETPIGISTSNSTATFSDLSVMRFVEYRLNRRDDRIPYPMRLGANQYFVVGDNVPVSIDSRQFGAISADQIVGKVTRLP
ncbi:Peptidase S26 [Novipirellula artificiosorum]|uniref:Signal peptidase I n=2 Tax=Novipirellula artificiosorum TaxID=2528016 RepID=A0A5C6DJV1_9BACT|nr:Peptidase S26 [Novipirellula artificiosorum]